ncbi:arsenate reductase (glutaredoxin) [Xinfangfangia sp. CPCC 101601]|uniref:Arsenate reductase n=1 Tax=Pseudogemmobacter lacusdianii TaxID=3069608 RepID=A0ABU0VWJ2_9RHOB|nr:arsenate reductase (glutaredoxin) [Xinfangfangia sp. CPCC 101601]MDQ2065993.1 arsenate reductase (glutaredoxin) [Xinfangfangia sp. CPCC 101601]
MNATIWHNPRCSTSRKALAALEAAGFQPQVVDYLKTGWTEDGLRILFAEAGLSARQALRAKEPLAAELGLKDATEAQILAAMVAHPILVERPFVRTTKGTRLCRPLALLDELLK